MTVFSKTSSKLEEATQVNSGKITYLIVKRLAYQEIK